MRVLFFAILLILLIPMVHSDTTFFDQDDAFVMSDFSTISTETHHDNCDYEWNCTDWSECIPSGKQTRNCTNIGTCSNDHDPPEIEQNCTYLPLPLPSLIEEKKELEEENTTEDKEEKKEEIEGEIMDRRKILLYSLICLIAVLIILCFKKNYFKEIIRKIRDPEYYSK